MQVTTKQRPGVYSSYTTSSITSYGTGIKSVGIVAESGFNYGEVCTITRNEDAQELFGEGSVMANLVETVLSNGASTAYCVGVYEEAIQTFQAAVVSFDEEDDFLTETPSDEEEEVSPEVTTDGAGDVTVVMGFDYEDAFALLEKEEGIGMMLCDSTDIEVQLLLRASVCRASEERKERIGIVSVYPDASVADCCTHGKELNHERMVLVAAPYSNDTDGIYFAAAVAGVLAAETDPALPMNGLELSGVSGLESNYSDSDVDLLITDGVLVLEQSSGVVSVIRGVTTSTMSGTVQDYTWRELTSIMVVDDVIPELRGILKTKFKRSKNTDATRGSIRSEVLIALERKKSKEIIVDYSDVEVEASETDGTICIVSFSFAVAHGLNQIWLTANVQI